MRINEPARCRGCTNKTKDEKQQDAQRDDSPDADGHSPRGLMVCMARSVQSADQGTDLLKSLFKSASHLVHLVVVIADDAPGT
jgi:hypothetical protein